MPRKGEDTEKTWFRTDRFYNVNGSWHFMTREGEELGPYGSKQDAQAALMLYIRSTSDEYVMGEYNSNKSAGDIWSCTFSH